MTSFDLVGVGSIVLDRIARAARIIGPEEKIALRAEPGASPFTEWVGGVTLNHLAWAALLGLRVGIVGRGSDDADGAFVRAGMDRLGVRHRLRLDGSSTALSLIFVDPAGERAIYMSCGANAEMDGDHIRDHHTGWLAASRLVSTEISQVPLSAVIAVLEAGRAAGATTILDVDIPRADALASLGTAAEFQQALALADIVKPAKNALEGLGLTGSTLEQAAALRDRLGCAAVAVTAGAAGCAIAAAGFEGVVPPAVVGPIVDTTGAGDAFLGGLAAGVALGLPWPQAGRLANACGAACCEITGAVPAGRGSLERVRALAGPALASALPEAPPPRTRATPDPARTFLATAAEEIGALQERVTDAQLSAAADLVLERVAAGARVHVTGVGKPGHAAHYVAALFASTGTPTTFLDALETTHGSAGQVARGDVVIAISNSGRTTETLAAVDAVKAFGAAVIAVTGRVDSELAQRADVVLPAPVSREGGPLGLAPRASVLAEIAVLTALSCALQERGGFTRHDYHQRHPAGALGQASADYQAAEEQPAPEPVPSAAVPDLPPPSGELDQHGHDPE